FNLDVEVEARMRRQLAPAITLLNPNGFENLDVFARLRQLANAGLIDRVHKRRRAAVHDGNFLAVDLDVAVVDRQTTEGCEQVLNRADGDTSVVTDHRAQRQILHVADFCGNLRNDPTTFADQEFQSGVGARRVQGNGDRSSAVSPLALQLDFTGN